MIFRACCAARTIHDTYCQEKKLLNKSESRSKLSIMQEKREEKKDDVDFMILQQVTAITMLYNHYWIQ